MKGDYKRNEEQYSQTSTQCRNEYEARTVHTRIDTYSYKDALVNGRIDT